MEDTLPGRTAWETRQYRLDHGQRAAYIAGLARLADHLREHQCTPLPVDGHLAPMPINFTGDDAEILMAETAAALGCDWTPTFTQGSHGVIYGLDGHLDGLRVRLIRYLEAPKDSPAEDDCIEFNADGLIVSRKPVAA
jgi:hypothetical protein